MASPPEDIDRARCWFRQGDACDLPIAGHNFGPFHAILASNLLCRYAYAALHPLRLYSLTALILSSSSRNRLPEPRKFLESLPRLLVPGGVAVIVSPYSWLEEYTAQEHWLGGVVRGGDSVSSAPALAEAMAALGFELVEQFDMPFLIREHCAYAQPQCRRFRTDASTPQCASTSGGAATPPCGAWAQLLLPSKRRWEEVHRCRRIAGVATRGVLVCCFCVGRA